MKPQELIDKLISTLSENNEFFRDVKFEIAQHVDIEIFRQEFKKNLSLNFLKSIESEISWTTDPNLIVNKKLAVKKVMWQLHVCSELARIKTERKLNATAVLLTNTTV